MDLVARYLLKLSWPSLRANKGMCRIIERRKRHFWWSEVSSKIRGRRYSRKGGIIFFGRKIEIEMIGQKHSD